MSTPMPPQQENPLQPMNKKEAKANAAAAKAYAKSQRNWFARHKILTGLAALILVGIIASVAGGGSSKGSVPAADDQAGVASSNNSAPAATKSAAPAAPDKAAAPKVLLKVSGNGAKQTQKFTAAGDWDLAYTYNCSNFGFKGNFQVFVYGGDGQMSLSNQGPNELGMKGSDVTHNHNGGTYYLQVNSECKWTMKVTG